MGIPSEIKTITRRLTLFVGSIATNRHTHKYDDYCIEVIALKEQKRAFSGFRTSTNQVTEEDDTTLIPVNVDSWQIS